MMPSSIWFPAIRTDREYTMPESEITAISVVPPPISTTMLPLGSVIGKPAPIAATIACSTRNTSLAFARYAEEVQPERFADVVVRVNDPRHPALVDRDAR